LAKAVEKAVIDTLMGQLTGREAIEGLTTRDVAKDGREFETVDVLVAEIYADIVEDSEMGNFDWALLTNSGISGSFSPRAIRRSNVRRA
jgi:hypothetical protein